jgi:hypothetical protein
LKANRERTVILLDQLRPAGGSKPAERTDDDLRDQFDPSGYTVDDP